MENRSGAHDILASLLRLFGPLCLETFFMMLAGVVDTLMLSSVGDLAVGAVGTANSYVNLVIVMFNIAATGMLAVYRPLSVDPETGEEPNGSQEHPYAFIYGMDVHSGKYYSYNNHLYLAKSDMMPCVWPPDTEGLWQWELVN